jgi:hypothetical protein
MIDAQYTPFPFTSDQHNEKKERSPGGLSMFTLWVCQLAWRIPSLFSKEGEFLLPHQKNTCSMHIRMTIHKVVSCRRAFSGATRDSSPCNSSVSFQSDDQSARPMPYLPSFRNISFPVLAESTSNALTRLLALSGTASHEEEGIGHLTDKPHAVRRLSDGHCYDLHRALKERWSDWPHERDLRGDT